MKPTLEGLWTALITPFQSNGEIDSDCYRLLLDRQVAAKVRGVVPCGTTGESATLSLEEKKQLIDHTIEHLAKTKVLVMAGTGTHSTRESVEFSRWSSQRGAHALLVVTPYYNKPTQRGLERHFLAIADAVECPIVLYNVPSRTGISLKPELVARLSKHSNICGIKEASASMPYLNEIIGELKKIDSTLTLLSGDDATAFPFCSLGGHGAISVASNIFPKPLVKMFELLDKENWKEARAIHETFFDLFQGIFCESNPIPTKWIMNALGLSSGSLRLPLVDLSHDHEPKLRAILAGLEERGFHV